MRGSSMEFYLKNVWVARESWRGRVIKQLGLGLECSGSGRLLHMKETDSSCWGQKLGQAPLYPLLTNTGLAG